MKIGNCEFPIDLYYDVEQGTWGRLREGVLRLGLTSLLTWPSGAFSSVTFKEVGTAVGKGQVVGSVEGSRNFGVVRSPISGTISLTNVRLIKEPLLLNKDPYGEGWFVEINVDNSDDLQDLKRLPEAEPAIARALEERNVRCFAEFPDYEMFDAGVECAAILVKLNELLANSEPRSVVHIISDDRGADVEMVRWAEQTGNALLESRKIGDFYHFIVRKKD
jgi:glycine cleavage system H protein